MRLDRITARHGLPHPLAILYDRLNQHDPREQLEELLRFAEGVARFLAWVLIADATTRGLHGSRLRQQVSANGYGGFLHVIDHNLRARRTRPDAFLRDLDGFINDPAWGALQTLGTLRNDAAHHRLPTTPEAARALLAAHRATLQQLLDGIAFLTRYPLGVLRGAEVTTGGVVTARWFACRGLSTRSGNVEVSDVRPLPTGQLLLIDPEARLALPLTPFFVCDEQALAWLDLPSRQGPARASVYARPLPGEALMPGVPAGLVDATGAAAKGLTLEAWLDDPRQRGRLLELRLDPGSLRALTQSAAPTQSLESQVAAIPAAAVLGGDGAETSGARRALAVPATRISEMPYAATMAMPRAAATTAATSVPPMVAAVPTRTGTAARAPRWTPPGWLIGLLIGLVVSAAAVVAWTTARPGDEARPGAAAPMPVNLSRDLARHRAMPPPIVTQGSVLWLGERVGAAAHGEPRSAAPVERLFAQLVV